MLVDLNADGKLELLAGRTAYRADGTVLWHRADLTDGFSAVADFDGDGEPEAVLVGGGKMWILEGATGQTELGPLTLPGTGSGGPPTVADFTGAGGRQVGVAMADFYSVVAPDYAAGKLVVRWSAPAHDFSSSVTGSTVFDFEGDGISEVVYNDECFLWVYDGRDGAVKFVGHTTSFTATEASLVADVDGDGKADIVVVHNGVSTTQWHCAHHTGTDAQRQGQWLGRHPRAVEPARLRRHQCLLRPRLRLSARPALRRHPPGAEEELAGALAQQLPPERPGVRPLRRPRCDGVARRPVRAVAPPGRRGAQSRRRRPAAGVTVGFFASNGGAQVHLGSLTTTAALFPGQASELIFPLPRPTPTALDGFVARILVDPAAPTFRECDEENNESTPARLSCIG